MKLTTKCPGKEHCPGPECQVVKLYKPVKFTADYVDLKLLNPLPDWCMKNEVKINQ